MNAFQLVPDLCKTEKDVFDGESYPFQHRADHVTGAGRESEIEKRAPSCAYWQWRTPPHQIRQKDHAIAARWTFARFFQ